MSAPRGRVLIVAGSDSGGGAGIQGDIKTVAMLGGYAATAVTAITVQNTLGVSAIHPIPGAIVASQIEAVIVDLGADAIKIGMLGDRATVEVVADALERFAPAIPVVLDPVMVAKGGASLLNEDAVEAIVRRLIPRAAIVTPNAPEAERLTGLSLIGEASQGAAGEALRRLGAASALIKGGHLSADPLVDLLVEASGATRFESPRLNTRHTHGTGCAYASAIATGLAQGLGLRDAVARAHAYVARAIAEAPGFGAGAGPIGHGWPLNARDGTGRLRVPV